MGLFNLQAPLSDHHAVSRGWVKANTVAQSGTTKVSDDWKITSGSYSYFHIEEGKAKIYHLQEPSHVDHPVTLGYANEHYAAKDQELDGFLKTDGSNRMGASLHMDGNKLISLGTPTTNSDAATKKYVDDSVVRESLMPAKFRWLYQPGDSNLLGDNRFLLYDHFLRIGPVPHNNQAGDFRAMCARDSRAHSINTFGSIYSWSSTTKTFVGGL